MKHIPKIQKNLKQHLTQESKDIMLKTAIGITTGAAILGSFTADVSAGHSNSWSPALPSTAANGTQITTVGRSTCFHASGVVNGHYSSVPAVNTAAGVTYTHSNHSSHSSCGGGHW